MTGDAHQQDIPEGSSSSSDASDESSSAQISSSQHNSTQTDRSTSSSPPGHPEIDDLEARLHQKDAALQNVIDRYEAVLEDQDPRDPNAANRRPDGLIDAMRDRVDELLTDVQIVVQSRREQ